MYYRRSFLDMMWDELLSVIGWVVGVFIGLLIVLAPTLLQFSTLGFAAILRGPSRTSEHLANKLAARLAGRGAYPPRGLLEFISDILVGLGLFFNLGMVFTFCVMGPYTLYLLFQR